MVMAMNDQLKQQVHDRMARLCAILCFVMGLLSILTMVPAFLLFMVGKIFPPVSLTFGLMSVVLFTICVRGFWRRAWWYRALLIGGALLCGVVGAAAIYFYKVVLPSQVRW